MIEPLRHLSVFSPHAWGDRAIDVIGAGATGSEVVRSLADLGVRCRVWDPDTVSAHNVANQAFGNDDIGRPKVEALRDIVFAKTGIKIDPRQEAVDGSQRLASVVFLLTDTMASRKVIFQGSIKARFHISLMIETRMGADEGRVYTINPSLPSHIRGWEGTLYSDEEAHVSVCGASVSVGPTARVIANMALWQMIRWFAIENGGDDILENELVIGLRPMTILSRMFSL